MWVEYLNKLGISEEEISQSQDFLYQLHAKHVLTIPFENLDIHCQVPIELKLGLIYQKIVKNARGGFCYELNYLFCELLKYCGFDAWLVSSRIYGDDQVPGPAFDHMSIMVRLEGFYLLDVGYGDLFIHPIKISIGEVTKDWFKFYKIESINESSYLLLESKDGVLFKKRYQFSSQAREISEFKSQCDFKQYDPHSYFVKNLICTLPNLRGRTTIINNNQIVKQDGQKVESRINKPSELHTLLKEKFGVEMQKELKLPIEI